jgi:GNAT superfamily N-acetyltransferase
MSFHIRDIVLPQDEAAASTFILGSQRYEHEIEPDRRLDAAVGAEFFAVLLEAIEKKQGRAFIAEQDGAAIGWAVFVVEEKPLFVVEAQRTHGYITELYVDAAARGLGVGQALMAACEAEARARGLSQIMIGLLTKNTRTAEIYAKAGYQPYTSELRKTL